MDYDAPGAARAPGLGLRLFASSPALAAAAQAWARYNRWRRVGSPAIHCSLVHTMLTLPFVPTRAPCCSATCVSTPQPRCLTCTTGYGGPMCACLTPSNNCNSKAQCRWGVGPRGGLLYSCLAAARPPGLGWIICRGQLPPHTCLSTPAHALPRCRLLQQLCPWQVHLSKRLQLLLRPARAANALATNNPGVVVVGYQQPFPATHISSPARPTILTRQLSPATPLAHGNHATFAQPPETTHLPRDHRHCMVATLKPPTVP